MFKSILVAVDVSHEGKGRELVTKARQLLDPGGRLTLVHVIDVPPSYILAELPADLVKRRHAEALEELRAVTDAEDAKLDVRAGHPATGILEAADENGCDLIMLASHRPGLEDYFLGSTAGRVVRHAQTSVLVLR